MKLTEHIYLVGSSCVGLSGQGDCNVYAVESQGDILLIDCGLSPDPSVLLQNLERDGLDPGRLQGVLLTHIHPDHTGAVPVLQKMGVPVLCSGLSARILREGMASFYPLDTLPDSPFIRFIAGTPRAEADRILEDGDLVTVGALSLRAIAAPAHSPDSMCYLLTLGERKHLFTGDTLFYPGQINYFAGGLSCQEGYPAVLEALDRLGPHGIYPGHALFAIDRGQNCTRSAVEWIRKGTLPPLKSYS